MKTATLPASKFPAEDASAEEILQWGLEQFGDRLAICTSFQAEGMVLIDMAARMNSGGVRIFTIDTDRLPQETQELMAEVRRRYGVSIEVVYPDAEEVASMVQAYGADLFYESVAKRRLCCELRKVRPLARKLADLDAWVVGLRRDQHETRQNVSKIEIDSEHGGIIKLSPLADWSHEQVYDYIRQHDVPLHKLYAQGYASIGCAPCTRPVRDDEHHRAGRWWWEAGREKECGIHFTANGEVRRELDVLLDEILHNAG